MEEKGDNCISKEYQMLPETFRVNKPRRRRKRVLINPKILFIRIRYSSGFLSTSATISSPEFLNEWNILIMIAPAV
jgi:hypothetical protein